MDDLDLLIIEQQPGIEEDNEVTDNHHVNDAKDDIDDNKENKIFEYDVFISHSKSDRPWVKDFLLQTLEQEGKKVCIDYRDFQAGLAVTDNIVHAVENSHVTILVLTPAFVESEWCMFESKRALLSSLATTRARVLPLILMECKIPNTLTHLTYLDHTSEDVQPYFKEQLIDSLDKAKTWSPKTEQLGSDIVPISDVQEVVTRTLDQKEEYKTAYRKLTGAFSSFKLFSRRINVGIVSPFVLLLVVYLVFLFIFIYFMAQQEYVITQLKQPSVHSTSSQIFLGFELKASVTDKCQSIRVTKRYKRQDPFLVDTYAFTEPANQVISTRTINMIHNKTSLPQKRLFKQKRFRIYGNVSLIAKFCIQSANPDQNAELWIYKPQNTDDTNKFDTSSEFDPEKVSVKHTEYKVSANQTYCNVSIIKGQKLQDNEYSNFVFYNPGPSMIFLNVSTSMNTPGYKANLAKRSCLNASECKLPSPSNYIIISKNINTPIPVWDQGDIKMSNVECIYKIPIVMNSIGGVFVLFLICLMIYSITKTYQKTCVPCLRKRYFQRKKIREKLGETAVRMVDDSQDLGKLYQEVKEETKKNEYVP